MDARKLSELLQGRIVSHLEANETHITLRFTDESALVIQRTTEGMSVVLHDIARPKAARSKDAPTARQREYLDFIMKYMAHYGVSPAETDLQQHFMVSAPSVHEMIKTLERRGFITRGRDFTGQARPRSIRVVADSF